MRPWSSAGDGHRLAETGVARGQVDRRVTFGAGDEADARAAGETVTVHIPARARAARRCAPAMSPTMFAVVAPGHETDVGRRRQPEQVEQPLPCELLGADDAGGGVAHPGVLVPGGDEPVGTERDREGAAHHPAVEPRRLDAHQARFDGTGQPLEHGIRIGAVLGKPLAELLPHLADDAQPAGSDAPRNRASQAFAVAAVRSMMSS